MKKQTKTVWIDEKDIEHDDPFSCLMYDIKTIYDGWINDPFKEFNHEQILFDLIEKYKNEKEIV